MTDHDLSMPLERISARILRLRGENVMLDADLADLYGVETKVLNQAVRRNPARFPIDFMFQLTAEEVAALRCQLGTSSGTHAERPASRSAPSDREDAGRLRSQIVTSNGRGGRRTLPYAFTEQGVAMLASVLGSERAIQVNIAIIRAFVRMRQVLASHAGLALKLDALERKYDVQFRVVFDAIRELMAKPDRPSRPLGFRPDDS